MTCILVANNLTNINFIGVAFFNELLKPNRKCPHPTLCSDESTDVLIRVGGINNSDILEEISIHRTPPLPHTHTHKQTQH